MPRSLLEAGAMGLPSIATDVPGCRALIEHGVGGVLCEARSVESLQAAIETVLAMSDAERAAMGSRARERVVAEFDEARVIRAVMDDLRAIEAKRGARV